MYSQTDTVFKEMTKAVCVGKFILKQVQPAYPCESMNLRAYVCGIHDIFQKQNGEGLPWVHEVDVIAKSVGNQSHPLVIQAFS